MTVSRDHKTHARETWSSLRATVVGLMQRADSENRRLFSLGLAQTGILLTLASAPDGTVRMNSLAKGAIVSRSALGRLVARMERSGLVKRSEAPNDLRGWNVTITDKGRALAGKVRISVSERLYTVFGSRLDEGDIQDLDRIIQKLWTEPRQSE